MPSLLSKMQDAAGNFFVNANYYYYYFEGCCNTFVKKQVEMEWKSLVLSSYLSKAFLKWGALAWSPKVSNTKSLDLTFTRVFTFASISPSTDQKT